MGLTAKDDSQPLLWPEHKFVAPRKAAQQRSMMRAGLGVAGALVVAAAGLIWRNRRS
jgi:hypothetical protein